MSNSHRFSFLILSSAIVFSLATTSWAQSTNSLSLRMDRLERMLQNNSQYKLLNQIKQLKAENQELRALIEEQANQNQKLQRRLHALYSDMDRRLVAIESDTSRLSQNQTDTQDNSQESTNTPVQQAGNNSAAEQTPPASKEAFNTDSENATTKEVAERQYAEQKAYQNAFEQLKALRYSKAEKSFSSFLNQYPDGRYAAIAQYWLAESSYAQRNFKTAISYYQKLLSNYPQSTKKAEALLKIAYCYYELGDTKKTRVELNTLIKNHPKTTEANQAKRLLKRL